MRAVPGPGIVPFVRPSVRPRYREDPVTRPLRTVVAAITVALAVAAPTACSPAPPPGEGSPAQSAAASGGPSPAPGGVATVEQRGLVGGAHRGALALVALGSLAQERGAGQDVIGGTVNTNGHLVVEARRVGADTTLAQIAKLVEDAQTSAAPVQRLADVVSAWFVPVVIGIAILALVGWLVLDAPFTTAFTSFIAVLIIACPCALGIATPAAIVAGTGKGAERGILVKGGQVLERTKQLDTVVFDKTGTLTVGKPKVTDVLAMKGDESALLSLAAAVEAGSEHPLARAIVEGARQRSVEVPKATGFQSYSGKGVKATVNGRPILIGTPAFLEENGVRLGQEAARLEELEAKGKTVLPVAVDGSYAGAIALMDTLKPGAKDAVAALQAMGFDVWMMTGDNEATGKAIAREVGIENVMARVLPADKAREVRELQRQGRNVAMVGDGVNDAPALAAADVGIALGSGTDVAVEAGGIVLMRDDVRDVVGAVQLSRRTLTKIRQNLFWAFAYNAVLIPVAALGLFGENGPILAGGAMALSSVSVVANALTLRLFKPRLDPARLRRVVTPGREPRDLPPLDEARPKRGLPVRPGAGTMGGNEMVFGNKKEKAETAIDPVCHMSVPTTTHRRAEHEGKTYHFCSDMCVERFRAAPRQFLS